jgi:hypothetical protein
MDTVDTVISMFAEYIHTDASRVSVNERTKAHIQAALHHFTIDQLRDAIYFAGEHYHTKDPEKFTLNYVFTPGLIDRWVWAARSKQMRRKFEWNIPQHMKRPEWLQTNNRLLA